jgi:hypothetical protein
VKTRERNEWSIGMSATEIGDSSGSDTVHDTKFWVGLKTQTGANTLGRLSMGSDFVGLREGAVLCCARPMTGRTGFYIFPCQCSGAQKVYYLPYKRGAVTSAKRSDYEQGADKCDFFLTYQLTGCRFVLTSAEVLHIARNVNNSEAGGPVETSQQESARRTLAEAPFIRGVAFRRLSVSNHASRTDASGYSADGDEFDHAYGENNAAFPIGVDMGTQQGGGTTWKYMYLKQPPSSEHSDGVWWTLINP